MSTITTKKEPNYLGLCYLIIALMLIIGITQIPPLIYKAEETSEQTEENNTPGKNGQHANQKAKKAAKGKYDQLKKEYDTLIRKPNKTKADKKELEKLNNVLSTYQQHQAN